MLTREELDRYGRQIILPGVGAAGQQRLRDSRVLVVGAGGLGAPALLYLAAAGVGTLGIADDDTVATSNLQRQVIYTTTDVGQPKAAAAAARLGALNPLLAFEAIPERVTAARAQALIQGFDIVLDGSDNLDTRYALSDACAAAGTPLVYGALEQFEGQVSVLVADGAGHLAPCYRCLYPVPPPEPALTCAEAGVFGVLPGIIGGLMAAETLKVLLGVGQPLAGTLLHYDALAATTYRVALRRNPACPACGQRDTGRGRRGAGEKRPEPNGE